jgi:hypothetical protein
MSSEESEKKDTSTNENGTQTAEAEEEAPPHPPCPTCGEEWEGKAVFCSYCGYEDTDEEIPLHPPPKFTGGIADTAGVLSADDTHAINNAIAGMKLPGPVFFATFNTPDGHSPAGVAYTIYNDATVGLPNADNGILVLYDPTGGRVEIAVGRELGKGLKAGDMAVAARELANAVAGGRIAEGFIKLVNTLLPERQ